MDFLRNRTFRKTLLVHQAVSISRQLRPDRILSLYVASNARSTSSNPDVRSISVEEFSNPEGLKFATDHPVTKSGAVAYPPRFGHKPLRLRETARSSVCAPVRKPRPRRQPARKILRCSAPTCSKAMPYSGRLIELRTWAPRFAAAGQRTSRGQPLGALSNSDRRGSDHFVSHAGRIERHRAIRVRSSRWHTRSGRLASRTRKIGGGGHADFAANRW